jgi:hypothetical protein
MASDVTKLRLSTPRDQAVEAILAALPKDAVVRGEDDGVGRFAGERTLVVVGAGKDRLMLFRGTWGTIKKRMDRPQLEVTFERRDDGVTARLTREPEKKRTILSHLGDFVSQAVTIAAVVVAYHLFRSLAVDNVRTVIIALGGALAWSAISHFFPGKPPPALHDLVRDALAPLAAPNAGASKDA